VKRQEAEVAELRKTLAEVTELRDNYRDAVLTDSIKAREGIPHADLGAAMNSPVTLQTFIDQLEKEAPRGRTDTLPAQHYVPRTTREGCPHPTGIPVRRGGSGGRCVASLSDR
jgi:hypothetical protein